MKRAQVWRPGDRVDAKTLRGWTQATVVGINEDGTCELAFDKGTRGRSWRHKNVRESVLVSGTGEKRPANPDDKEPSKKQVSSSQKTSNATTSRTSGGNEGGADLVFLHFNDAYHETHKKTGGAARFLTALKHLRARFPISLTVFSGDAFSPSVTSAMMKGWNMHPVMNALDIDVATLGNHELDHGHSNFNKLRAKSNFPWVCSNLVQKRNGHALGYCEKYFTTDCGGINIGFLGLGEKEWLACLNDRARPPGGIEYQDYNESNKLVQEMKDVDNAQVIVSLSHVRWASDIEIANGVKGIDVVLGGHDHFYRLGKVGKVPMVNSGTDFEQLSVVEMFRKDNPNAPAPSTTINPDGPSAVVEADEWTYRMSRVDVTEEAFKDDPSLSAIIAGIGEQVDKKLDHVVGCTVYDIDAMTPLARTGQSPAGSWICDIIRQQYRCDFGLVHGGSVRSNAVYKAGPLTLRDVRNIFPFADMIGVFEVTGQQMWDAFENGVSQYPETGDGRFPQISGLRFVFDGERPVGQRIVSVDVGDTQRGWVPLDLARKYSMGTLSFICTGNNDTGLVDMGLGGGYKMFRGSRVIRDEENGHVSFQLVLDHIYMIKALNRFTRFDKVKRPQQVIQDVVSKFFELVAKGDSRKMAVAKAKQNLIQIFNLDPIVPDGRIKVMREGKPVAADMEAQRYFLERMQQKSG